MTPEIEFTPGQVVEAVETYGYHLTGGKRYVVVSFRPKEYTPTFTWPAYVEVIADHNVPVLAYPWRFRAAD